MFLIALHRILDLVFLFKMVGHSMSSQPPDRQHVTDFAEILHTIWEMKKNSGT